MRLETQVILELLQRVVAGEIELVSSEFLEMEAERNDDAHRRLVTEEVLALASEVVEADADVMQRTAACQALGLKGFDAAHLACAVHAGVDFLCTCDDKFLRRARRLDTALTRPVSPLELIREVQR